MASLRQRRREDPSPTTPTSASASASDSSLSKNDDDEEVCLVPVSELQAVSQKGRKRRTWSIFVLGGLFGLLLAALFAGKDEVIEFADQHWENLGSILPAGLLKDAKDLSVSLGEQTDVVRYS